MGILDQLKKEVDSKKQTVTEDADLAQRREQVYQQALLPAMQKLLKSLQEVLEYMKDLGPVEIQNYSTKRPEVGKLVQGDYRLNTDGKGGFAELSKLMEINLSCRLKGEYSYRYSITGKLAADTEMEFLNSRNFKAETKTELQNNVPVVSFAIERNIPVFMRFEVDYNNSCIKFNEYNYDNFSTSTQNFAVADLTEEWMDQFLRFLLRKDGVFTARLKRRMPL